ncbi:MAG: hypothetical protein HYS27_22040 [Deltaproteobacteria bacterium]|nr:hypothetical protein [Deltaproteobacteria bacterium]
MASCDAPSTEIDAVAGPAQASALSEAAGDVQGAQEPACQALVLPTSYGLRSAQQAVQLEITSALPVATEAVVEVLAIDETQVTKVVVPLGAVPAASTVVLDLPVRSLPHPRRALKVAGVVSLFTSLRLPDGGGLIPDFDGVDLISYHPEPGGLRLYDEETRRTQFRGGALDDALAATIPTDGVLAPSYVGPTMPLDLQPTFSGESEPDPDHVLLGVQP